MPRQGPERSARQRARMRRLGTKVQAVATSDEVLDALEEARLDPAKLGQLKANPRAYLRGTGADIPRDVEVEFTEGSSWLVCFYYYYWFYRVQYCYYIS